MCVQTVFWLSVGQNFAPQPKRSASGSKTAPESALHCENFVRRIRRSIETKFYATDMFSGGATLSGSGQT
jgi:hypothetical protein